MVLFHPDRGRLFLFNHSAHLLWRALRVIDATRLTDVLVSRYGLPPQIAERDARAIVSQWVDNGLANFGDGRHDDSSGRDAPASEPSDVSPRGKMAFYRFASFVVGLSADASIDMAVAPLIAHLQIADAEPDMICVVGRSGADRRFLAVDGRVAVDDAEDNFVIGAFFQAVLERLHPGAQWRAFMHAAAVARNGKVAIFPAPSGSGKSTLTAYLVSRGYEYFSDDLVPLLTQGDTVAPFPLPTSVKPGAASVLARYYPTLNGGERSEPQYLIHDMSFSRRPAQARALIFPRYLPGAPTRFEPLSVTDAMARLLGDRIYLGYPLVLAAVRGFVDWLGRVRRHELIYSDIEEAERCVSQALTT
jgi:hypothetical protein